MATGDTASDPFSRSGQNEGEEGSLTFNGDTTILTGHQAGRKGDIVEEHGRAPSRDAQIVRPSTAKLREVNALLMQRRHWPIPEQGQWLGSVVRGHIAYYAVPGNSHAVSAFRKQVTRHWDRALRRRSQRHRVTWERMGRLEARWLPPARITHPWPNVRFDARTQGRSPVR